MLKGRRHGVGRLVWPTGHRYIGKQILIVLSQDQNSFVAWSTKRLAKGRSQHQVQSKVLVNQTPRRLFVDFICVNGDKKDGHGCMIWHCRKCHNQKSSGQSQQKSWSTKSLGQRKVLVDGKSC